MRPFVLIAVIALASCTKPPPPGAELIGTYRGVGRDALCIAKDGERLKAGLITYGDNDPNCSLRGTAVVAGDGLTIIPRGDSACRVELRIANDSVTIGRNPAACAFYCGPGADFAGRKLKKAAADAARVSDFAGDPLC